MLVLLAFASTLLIQLYFYLFIFSKYAWNKDGHHPEFSKGVSVVISARNEAENLSNKLKFVEGQTFPDYEIIVVDDGSSDRTPVILEDFRLRYSREDRMVHIVNIDPDDSKGKKQALAAGIEKASKEIILVTDADCIPSSSHWIKEMTSAFSDRNKGFELVLGYGAYKKISGSLINKLIRYETLLTAVQYFSYALHGFPYMGVGRNMAYSKRLYRQANGFSKHLQVKSGDDDLFVNQIANRDNTAICDHPDAFTISDPKRDLASWIRQKRRHITTASYYRRSQQISLMLFVLSQIGFYVLGIILLSNQTQVVLVIGLIAIRFVAYYSILWPASKRLDEKDLLPLAPLYEISIIFMQLYVFVHNKLSPAKHW